MGITYKLTEEIKTIIKEKKKEHPTISCRGLVKLLREESDLRISKSAINSVFKESGLSMPVGRRGLKKKPIALPEEFKSLPPDLPLQLPVKQEVIDKLPVQIEAPQPQPVAEEIKITQPEISLQPEIPLEETTGAVLLKAADFLVGGLAHFNDWVKHRLRIIINDLYLKNEALLYSFLFDVQPYTNLSSSSPLWGLIHKRFNPEELLSYLAELKKVTELKTDLPQVISPLFKQVRGVKLLFSDNTNSYLDGQFHTIWSSPYTPYDFSTTLSRAKIYLNNYFFTNAPLILSMASGYDIPTADFFDFILNLDNPQRKRIASLSLYGNQLEDLEVVKFEQVKRRYFIFGLWPWQFGQYRKVNKISEFRIFEFKPLGKKFYLADINIDISQPKLNKTLTLRGCVLKASLKENVRLAILTNLEIEKISAEALCGTYLQKWPNLEECFQDYSRKIELFTYTAGARRLFTTQDLASLQNPADISNFFENYLKTLDLYLRLQFFPASYENKDFSTMKEDFYQLKTSLEDNSDCCLAIFHPPEKYTFLADLDYICRRLNEKEILFPNGKRIWFTIK